MGEPNEYRRSGKEWDKPDYAALIAVFDSRQYPGNEGISEHGENNHNGEARKPVSPSPPLESSENND